jgi:hypothetical protein
MTSLNTRLTAAAVAGLTAVAALAVYAQTLALPTHFV